MPEPKPPAKSIDPAARERSKHCLLAAIERKLPKLVDELNKAGCYDSAQLAITSRDGKLSLTVTTTSNLRFD